MTPVNIVVAAYGILSIALGVYGYSKSPISLIAGGIAGLLVLGSLALVKTQPRVARIGVAVIALLMLLQMGKKAVVEQQWHQITMSIASLIVIIVLVGAHLAATSRKRAA